MHGTGVSPPSRHAVVIGAGFGGIAAALRARALGCEVTLIEQLPQLGGRARVLRQDGFLFDAGPTVITAPFLFEELFALFGEALSDHVTLLPVAPWYRILLGDGRIFDYDGDEAAMRAQVARFCAGDARGYERLLARSRQLYDVGFTRYGDMPFHRPSTMLAALAPLLRLGGLRSVHGLVARHLRDPGLRQVFSLAPLLVGGHPFRTTSIYALIQALERRAGIWFPRGGTGALVDALEALMRRNGIIIRTGQAVRRIEAAGRSVRGVTLACGRSIAADLVIANSDAPALYRDLLPRSARRRWSNRRLDRLHYSMGLFVLYFGTGRRFGTAAHHTILLGPRYRELLDEIFDGNALPAEPSLYLHRPTATDPAMAPPGQDAFYVLAPVPNLRAGIDWPSEARAFGDRILAILERRLLPGLRASIVTRFHMTPVDFARDYGSRFGSGFSIAPELRQSAWFRFHNRSEELRGLYLVGAGTHPGAGVPGVLSSAKVVERLLRREWSAS